MFDLVSIFVFMSPLGFFTLRPESFKKTEVLLIPKHNLILLFKQLNHRFLIILK